MIPILSSAALLAIFIIPTYIMSMTLKMCRLNFRTTLGFKVTNELVICALLYIPIYILATTFFDMDYWSPIRIIFSDPNTTRIDIERVKSWIGMFATMYIFIIAVSWLFGFLLRNFLMFKFATKYVSSGDRMAVKQTDLEKAKDYYDKSKVPFTLLVTSLAFLAVVLAMKNRTSIWSNIELIIAWFLVFIPPVVLGVFYLLRNSNMIYEAGHKSIVFVLETVGLWDTKSQILATENPGVDILQGGFDFVYSGRLEKVMTTDMARGFLLSKVKKVPLVRGGSKYVNDRSIVMDELFIYHKDIVNINFHPIVEVKSGKVDSNQFGDDDWMTALRKAKDAIKDLKNEQSNLEKD